MLTILVSDQSPAHVFSIARILAKRFANLLKSHRFAFLQKLVFDEFGKSGHKNAVVLLVIGLANRPIREV